MLLGLPTYHKKEHGIQGQHNRRKAQHAYNFVHDSKEQHIDRQNVDDGEWKCEDGQ